MHSPGPAVHTGIPGPARRLIWEIFFTQAGRGVSFDAHLPWADLADTRCVVLDDAAGTVLATAVIRPAPQPGVAMIGFVCVAEEARGHGYAKRLIAHANEAVDAAGCHATLLWTSKPQVYASLGYAIIGQDSFVQVTRLHPNARTMTQIAIGAWPGSQQDAGLPAFATSGTRYRSDHAEVVVVNGARGATVIDWRGSPGDVVALLDGAAIGAWSVNTPTPELFVAALDPALFTLTVSQGPLTMARRAADVAALDYVPVAARI